MKKIFFIFILMMLLIVFPVFADELTKLDQGGMRILTIFRRIAYWIILVKCIADLLKAGIEGDTTV